MAIPDGFHIEGPIPGAHTKSAKAPPTYEPGRVCATPECGTVLSRYNPRDTCFRHSPPEKPVLRGRRLRR